MTTFTNIGSQRSAIFNKFSKPRTAEEIQKAIIDAHNKFHNEMKPVITGNVSQVSDKQETINTYIQQQKKDKEIIKANKINEQEEDYKLASEVRTSFNDIEKSLVDKFGKPINNRFEVTNHIPAFTFAKQLLSIIPDVVLKRRLMKEENIEIINKARDNKQTVDIEVSKGKTFTFKFV